MVDSFQLERFSKEAIVQLIEIERDKINFYGSFILPLITGILAVSLTKEYNTLTDTFNYALIVAGIFLIIVVILLNTIVRKNKKVFIFLKRIKYVKYPNNLFNNFCNWYCNNSNYRSVFLL